MASLFAQTIAVFCLGITSGTYNGACNHALDAGTRQIGVRQQADMAEDKTAKIVVNGTEDIFGKSVLSVVGASGFIYKTAKNKSLSFRLPTLGFCDGLSNEITTESYHLIVEWKL